MDYEKRFYKILDWARSAIDAGADGMLKEDLLHLLPELKESEDERIRKAIIHYILYETKGAISEATEHTWVKWLDKQKEQQPAEWSEEDKPSREMILAIWELGNEWKESRPTGFTQLKYIQEHWKESTYYDKIKSLRPQPHWKPTSEQIQALTIAVDEATRCEEPYWRDSLHDVLLSLHTDLKNYFSL